MQCTFCPSPLPCCTETLVNANAWCQAAFCIAISRKLIPAVHVWKCPLICLLGRNKLLIGSPGCHGHPEGDLEVCLVLILVLVEQVELPELNKGVRLDIRNFFFLRKSDYTLAQLLREVVDSPSLEVFRNQPWRCGTEGHGLGSWWGWAGCWPW